jgi:hypothetical protein
VEIGEDGARLSRKSRADKCSAVVTFGRFHTERL